MNQTPPVTRAASAATTALAFPVYRPTCSRCGGSGYLRQYNHVQAGVCFRCGGSGRG